MDTATPVQNTSRTESTRSWLMEMVNFFCSFYTIFEIIYFCLKNYIATEKIFYTKKIIVFLIIHIRRSTDQVNAKEHNMLIKMFYGAQN